MAPVSTAAIPLEVTNTRIMIDQPSDHDDPMKWDAVHTYTRKQALEDGIQVAVPRETSREAGILFPVFLTRTVWDKYVEVPPGAKCQDEAGRLWDILWMMACGIRSQREADTIRFQLYVRNDNHRPKRVTLKARVDAADIDDPQPAITVLLPDED